MTNLMIDLLPFNKQHMNFNVTTPISRITQQKSYF